MLVTVPVDVSVVRYYRLYVDVQEDATDHEIRKAASQLILDDSDVLNHSEDPSIDVEEQDIVSVNIDHDGMFAVME